MFFSQILARTAFEFNKSDDLYILFTIFGFIWELKSISI